jgi:hypothetical protein
MGDPVAHCPSPDIAFPTLSVGQCARLVHRDRVRLVYALGDEHAPHPFQHVVVRLPRDGHTPTVQWYVSKLVAGSPQVVVDGRRGALRAQHFFTGRRGRLSHKERALQHVLTWMNDRHDGDPLRAFQNRTLERVPAGACPIGRVHVLAFHIWHDVMREYTDRLRRMVHTGNPRELLRVAVRMERLYPPPPPIDERRSRRWLCNGGWRWRWWRWRLAHRLRYRYPLLTPRAARALASDITYVTQCPRAVDMSEDAVAIV